MKISFTERISIAGLVSLLVIFSASSSVAQSSVDVFAVTTTNNLLRFNSNRPGTILRSVAVTGLQPGESVLGIDFRPATGQLYGLGSSHRLYRLDTLTGAATLVGSPGAFILAGSSFGFDVNPVPDRIRAVSNVNQNLRLNPNDGSLTGTDGLLAYASTDPNSTADPNVVGSAYTNSFAGSTSTTLYGIDSNLNILVTQVPPNNGTLNTVGSLGVDIGDIAGFDIAGGNNTALAAIHPPAGSMSSLYQINLSTGSASLIGTIGGGVIVRGIAMGRNTSANASVATPDFDGDGRTDYSVFRPGSNTWYVNRSSDNSFFSAMFGVNATDVLTPGDYDGDGKGDIAVWRDTTGTFYILRSSDGGATIFKWGASGDKAVPRDYDGDSKTDFAVARVQGGLLVWYILNSSNGSARVEQFGLGGDVGAPGDYDGDGRYDLAVVRAPGPGLQAIFYVRGSSAGFSATAWGLGGDAVVPGDYDGDGKTDLAVVRTTSSRTWYVRRSLDGALFSAVFGTPSHITTQGDYDGDAKTDVSTWDPATGIFYVLRSSVPGTASGYQFGIGGDKPVANFYTH